jgi:hypothetical protein
VTAVISKEEKGKILGRNIWKKSVREVKPGTGLQHQRRLPYIIL